MEEYWRILNGRLVNVLRPSVFANCHLLKLSSYPPTEPRDREPFLITFQREGFQVLEKDISGLQKIYISKRKKKNL